MYFIIRPFTVFFARSKKLPHWIALLLISVSMAACVAEDTQIDGAKKLIADRKLQEAVEQLNRIIEGNSSNARAFNTRGVAYLEMKNYDNADLDFEQAMRLDPNNYQPYFNRATSKGEQGRWDDALADINKAVQLQPDTSENYAKRGIILAATGRLQDALKDFDKVILMKSADFNAVYNRGNLL